VKKIRVVIVDDHEIVRHGLTTFLGLQDDIDIVAEGKNGREAVALAAKHLPDIMLMDLIMPEMDGVEATREILERNPDAKVLILSSFSDDRKVLPAVEAGAFGYLLKDIAPADLATAIREAHRGKAQLHPEITRKLMARMRNPGGAGMNPDGTEPLTARETDVLRCLARGMSNDEIASELFISPLTVKTHVSNLLAKLKLADRTQAAIYAIRNGIAPDS